jgi:2-methylcitrate dehydratase PrpD
MQNTGQNVFDYERLGNERSKPSALIPGVLAAAGAFAQSLSGDSSRNVRRDWAYCIGMDKGVIAALRLI